MRLSPLALVVLIGAAFPLVGCSHTASPTSPTAAQSTSAASRPAVAATPHEVPFKGVIQGTDADSEVTPTSVVVTTSGTGTATHLGQFSVTQRVTVDLGAGTSAGTARWVAANGDSIETTIAGTGQPTGAPGEIRILETHTIRGGTGRFADARGQFIVERVASALTFVTSGSFEGTIAVSRAEN